jgi:uncharacterized protein (DUF302 family)
MTYAAVLRNLTEREGHMPGTTGEYAFHIRLDLPYEQAVERVTAALKEQGFGVLTEIDVQATLKKKLDVGFRKYVILGACNPPLAHRALSADLEIGLLLPCNVVIYEDQGASIVSIADPVAMLGLAEKAGVESVALEARERLQRVLNALQA